MMWCTCIRLWTNILYMTHRPGQLGRKGIRIPLLSSCLCFMLIMWIDTRRLLSWQFEESQQHQKEILRLMLVNPTQAYRQNLPYPIIALVVFCLLPFPSCSPPPWVFRLPQRKVRRRFVRQYSAWYDDEPLTTHWPKFSSFHYVLYLTPNSPIITSAVSRPIR